MRRGAGKDTRETGRLRAAAGCALILAAAMLCGTSAAAADEPPAQAASSPASQPADRLEAARLRAAAQRLNQELTVAWFAPIEAHVRRPLASDRPEQQEEGRRRLARIRDPLALMPLIRSLGKDDAPAVRMALAEHLPCFTAEDAVVQLTVMCLTDPEPAVRGTAAVQLASIGDQRGMALLTAALACGHEPMISAAAEAIRTVRHTEAIDALADALTAADPSALETLLAARKFLDLWRRTWTQAFGPQLAPGALIPRQGELSPDTRWMQRSGMVEPDVPDPQPVLYRTTALETLRAITGEDFGFDSAGWRQWWVAERNRRKLLPRPGE